MLSYRIGLYIITLLGSTLILTDTRKSGPSLDTVCIISTAV